jgi:hypothetical protein
MNRYCMLIAVVLGKTRWPLFTLVLAVWMAACGGTDSLSTLTSPTLPTIPIPGVSGRWTQDGGTRTWKLDQVGTQAGGDSSFSQDDNPNFGAVSGNGYVVGSAAFGTFRFTEVYEALSLSSRSSSGCAINVDGLLTVTGDSMTGSYTETDSCAGVRLGQITGRLTMRRR